MTFLYKTDMDEYEVTQCPPASATPMDIVAWRWTFSPHGNSCFLPLVKLNPRRINDPKMLDKCSCFGLSLYATQAQAEAVFSELEKTFKKARKSIGTHVSRGELTTSDGVVTDIDEKGHFDFHPYLGIDIKAKFSLIREIPCLS